MKSQTSHYVKLKGETLRTPHGNRYEAYAEKSGQRLELEHGLTNLAMAEAKLKRTANNDGILSSRCCPCWAASWWH